MELKQPDRLAIWERHFQTIVLGLAATAICFAATFIYTTKGEMAAMHEQMQNLTQLVMELRSDIKAMQTNYITKDEFKDHETRIRALELKK